MGRFQRTPEQKRRPPSSEPGRPARHVGPGSPSGTHLSSIFTWRPPTNPYDASWPLFQVILIQGLRFIPPGYITRCRLMNTGPIFCEVTGKFDLWRSWRWRSSFKSDTIRTLQSLHHYSVGYQPSTTWLTSPRRLFLQANRRAQARR
jgi:hypothetical protein